MYGFLESEISDYVGIDVIPKVCQTTLELAELYNFKNINIYCQPSEDLLKDKHFLVKCQVKYDSFNDQQKSEYDYFTKNNILNMDWHSYRLGLFTKDIEKEKFYNLAYKTPSYCISTLFHHQT